MKIDFNDYEVIAPVKRKKSKQVVSVFGDGTFAINDELVKELKTNQFEVRLYKNDCSRLLLIPEGGTLTDMGKNNRIKSYDFSSKLLEKK